MTWIYPSPRPVVSWKFTLTSTKDLCAFHRARARKRKFDRVWSWMYSNDLEYLRAFLVGQGAFRDSDPIHFTPPSLPPSRSHFLSWIRNAFNFSLSLSPFFSMNLSKRWIRYNRSEIKKEKRERERRITSSRKVYEVSRKLTRVGEGSGEGSIFNLALFYES